MVVVIVVVSVAVMEVEVVEVVRLPHRTGRSTTPCAAAPRTGGGRRWRRGRRGRGAPSRLVRASEERERRGRRRRRGKRGRRLKRGWLEDTPPPTGPGWIKVLKPQKTFGCQVFCSTL